MDVKHYLRVAPFLNDCPFCDSDKGVVEVKENLISRNCPCGFDITINVKNGTSKAKIKKSIEFALEKMK